MTTIEAVHALLELRRQGRLQLPPLLAKGPDGKRVNVALERVVAWCCLSGLLDECEDVADLKDAMQTAVNCYEAGGITASQVRAATWSVCGEIEAELEAIELRMMALSAPMN